MLTEAEVIQRWHSLDRGHYPQGSVWRHYRTGRLYVVETISLREADLVPLITYYPFAGERVRWTRPLADFTVEVPGKGGLMVRRFQREG